MSQKESISPEEIELRQLLATSSNSTCADCGAKFPRFASITLAIFLCNRCYGIHRAIGAHITRTKCVGLDKWTSQEVHRMRTIGNAIASSYWECNVPKGSPRLKPTPDSSNQEVEIWIRNKYEKKMFCPRDLPPPHAPEYIPRRPTLSIKRPSLQSMNMEMLLPAIRASLTASTSTGKLDETVQENSSMNINIIDNDLLTGDNQDNSMNNSSSFGSDLACTRDKDSKSNLSNTCNTRSPMSCSTQHIGRPSYTLGISSIPKNIATSANEEDNVGSFGSFSTNSSQLPNPNNPLSKVLAQNHHTTPSSPASTSQVLSPKLPTLSSHSTQPNIQGLRKSSVKPLPKGPNDVDNDDFGDFTDANFET